MAEGPCPRRGGPRSGPPPRGRFGSGPARAILILAAAGALGACGGGGPAPPAPAAGPALRIVSLAPSHTETLFALGAGDAVVGVTRFCDRPPEAKSRPAVGDAQRVNLEAVAALRPDLVVANADATVDALAPLRGTVRVLALPTDTLPDLLRAVESLGAAVGRRGEARALRDRVVAALADARRRCAGRPRPRVLVVVQRDPYFVAGRTSYVAALLDALGCDNAAGDVDSPWPAVSAEALIVRAPDAIVDASLGPAGEPSRRDDECERWWARFPSIPAVRDGRVRALRDEAALRPGPAVAEALRALDDSIAREPAAAATGVGGGR